MKMLLPPLSKFSNKVIRFCSLADPKSNIKTDLFIHDVNIDEMYTVILVSPKVVGAFSVDEFLNDLDNLEALFIRYN